MKIAHFTSILLLHYIVKFECLAVQLFILVGLM